MEVRPTQMIGQQQHQFQDSGTQHLDGVRAVYGGASLNETAASHARSETDSEDMAVSGEAPVELVSAVPQGTPDAVVQSTDFRSVYETVELSTDSESVVEGGGHGLGFNHNRSEVTPLP